jgi:hypothetical protein
MAKDQDKGSALGLAGLMAFMGANYGGVACLIAGGVIMTTSLFTGGALLIAGAALIIIAWVGLWACNTYFNAQQPSQAETPRQAP